MAPTGHRQLRLVLVGIALLLAWPAAAVHAAGYAKSTHQVPVSQPDELGLPVTIDTDVYLPAGAPPASGHPLVAVFHGGGSSKASEFDSEHAAFLAEHGYAVVLYSARGHGSSGGQTSVIGPKELRDVFDVLGWALGVRSPLLPSHPDFRLDRSRIALAGYSQGGLHTNLGQAWSGDPAINPYGISFGALLPANTPDRTFEALVTNQVVKLSFGVGLLGTYAGGAQGRVAPIVEKWIATAGADRPELYGGDVCDVSGHDTPGSTMKADLAFRSPGCNIARMTPPSLWMQSFDDGLFPAQMAISMWRRMPAGSRNRLYLTMGGHAAPGADRSVEDAKLRLQLAFLDHVLRGRPLAAPRVVYWLRDPDVRVNGAARYPRDAWLERTSPGWPPPGTHVISYRLGADGKAVSGDAPAGSAPLAPFTQDQANDPVAQSALSGTPAGSSPAPAAPPSGGVPGQVASFQTAPLARDTELDGSPSARLAWTPASADTQLVLKVFDAAPDGTLTLLSRGVLGMRGATSGQERSAVVTGDVFGALLRRGHRLVAWVTAGDASFYKAYPGSAGGTLRTGNASTLQLPLRAPGARSCAPRRLWLRPARAWRIRVGQRRRTVLRRAGRPVVRKRHAYRYCVIQGGRVVVAFSRRGRARLVATTAPGHTARRRLAKGGSLRRARRAYPRLRRVRRGVYVAKRRWGGVVLGVRGGRVRYVALTGRREARSPRLLRVYLRRAALRPR